MVLLLAMKPKFIHDLKSWIIRCLTFLSCVLILCLENSCSIDARPTEFQDGFSEEMVTGLEENHGVKISSDAIFVKGYCNNAFRDASSYIVFRLPCSSDMNVSDAVAPILDDEWSVLASIYPTVEAYPSCEMVWHAQHSKNMFREFYCSDPVDGMITCYLIVPGNPTR